jgi:hypothetical protein
MIGYAKPNQEVLRISTDCSFPVSIFGEQQKVNPYVHPTVNGKKTDAGNAKTPEGQSRSHRA